MTKWFAFETIEERNACVEAREPGTCIVVNSYAGKDPAGNPANKTLRQYWDGAWKDLVPGEFIPAAPPPPNGEQPVDPPVQPPRPTRSIIEYPFNKDAWCNRPIGEGVPGANAYDTPCAYYGIPAAGGNGAGPVTPAIPMKADFSNPLGDVIGDLKLEGGKYFTKYLFPYDAINRLYEIFDIDENGRNPVSIGRDRIPSAMELIFACNGMNSGTDNNLMIYVEESDELNLYFSADFNTNDNKWYVAFRRKYSLKGPDWNAPWMNQDKGSSASGVLHPAGHYLWNQYLQKRKLRTTFQASATRGAKSAMNYPKAHILGQNRIRPATSMDSGASNNRGKLPYGTLLAIPVFHRNKRSQLGLDDIGFEFFDGFFTNGIRVVDGNGETVNNGTQGVLQLRIQQTSIIQQPPSLSYQWPSTDRDKINAQLRKMKHLLYPIMVTGGFEGPGAQDSEYHAASGICFAGKGGPIDRQPYMQSMCNNLAWDAPYKPL